MTENKVKIIKILTKDSRLPIGPNTANEVAQEILKSLALPLVSDCVIVKQYDCLLGEFEMQCCGNCKTGPITKLENYCPKCGHKIGKHCR